MKLKTIICTKTHNFNSVLWRQTENPDPSSIRICIFLLFICNPWIWWTSFDYCVYFYSPVFCVLILFIWFLLFCFLPRPLVPDLCNICTRICYSGSLFGLYIPCVCVFRQCVEHFMYQSASVFVSNLKFCLLFVLPRQQHFTVFCKYFSFAILKIWVQNHLSAPWVSNDQKPWYLLTL